MAIQTWKHHANKYSITLNISSSQIDCAESNKLMLYRKPELTSIQLWLCLYGTWIKSLCVKSDHPIKFNSRVTVLLSIYSQQPKIQTSKHTPDYFKTTFKR